jgi:heptosyltransferase III
MLLNYLMFFSKYKNPKHVLVCREDAMGDVILAMPVCGLIKKHYPGCKVSFLGRTYTRDVASCCSHIDEFLNYDDWKDQSPEELNRMLQSKQIDVVVHLLKVKPVVQQCAEAAIPIRIGAANVLFYWKYCNRLVLMTRKKSRLSEAQLNIKLLRPLNITQMPARNDVHQYYGLNKIPALLPENKALLNAGKFNLILHPLSNKNAKEWGLHNFSALLKLVDLNRFNIFITGSPQEKEILKDWISENNSRVTDLTGKMDMKQLISFIAASDGLIASSTGPVHVAAAAGINTLGLYENRWVKRGERWGPLGKKADFLQCINEDMNTITPEMVWQHISNWTK